jgi:hypothetical protein
MLLFFQSFPARMTSGTSILLASLLFVTPVAGRAADVLTPLPATSSRIDAIRQRGGGALPWPIKNSLAGAVVLYAPTSFRDAR